MGLSAGDTPCGDDAHVASIADGVGRYLAFCVNASGRTSVLQITPGGVAPVGAPSACALDTFLAASPEGTPVPRVLVAACQGAPRLARGCDLRFTVTPSTGAWYRYTGAYIEYFPVP